MGWYLKKTKPTAVEVKTSGKWVAYEMRVLLENGEPILAVIHESQITMRLQVSSLTKVKYPIPDKTPNYFHIFTNGKLMKVRTTGVKSYGFRTGMFSEKDNTPKETL